MKDKELTIEKSLADFKKAYKNKSKLLERQKDDFLFRLGKQWSAEQLNKLKEAGIKPVTDNRIQPNIFLLTGLERQNRSDFKAFPEGEEDSLKAEIATYLFKDSVKKSDFGYKASESFEDGVTCGESELELFLDNTHSLLNAKPCWKKLDSNMVFPEPGCKEYDYSDARYLYKLTTDVSKEDLMSMYPEKAKLIEKSKLGKLEYSGMEGGELHRQPKDYLQDGTQINGDTVDQEEQLGDLLERYYKKWVKKFYIGDRETGKIEEAESEEKADAFVNDYQGQIANDQAIFEQATLQYSEQQILGQVPPEQLPPPAPPQRDPKRFIRLTRMVPEMWCFAHAIGIDKEPLCDERAWFYPEWKGYPIIPYFAHFSTAPITGDDAHLLIQGIVYGVKGVQEKHNSMETLKVMYLNSSANGGWLTEEDTWVDEKKVQQFGASPGVNLSYKQGKPVPTRIFPMQVSQGHSQISAESAEAIKAILGMNADLLASQEGGADSGRAIALRQKQGLLMVQKLFDNHSRTKQLCGRLLLSQLGKIYDTETAKKVLGEAYLQKTFPPPMMYQPGPDGNPILDPATGQPQQVPMPDPKTGQPMTYDAEMAEVAIAEVLSGELWQYDVTVGEAVASETMKLAQSMEIKDLATSMPGIIPPDVLVEESQLSQSAKSKILTSIRQAQAMAMQQPVPAKKGE